MLGGQAYSGGAWNVVTIAARQERGPTPPNLIFERQVDALQEYLCSCYQNLIHAHIHNGDHHCKYYCTYNDDLYHGTWSKSGQAMV